MLRRLGSMHEQIVLPVGIPQGTGGNAEEEGQEFC